MDMDFLLVQRMRLGDEKALESFVKKYYPLILKYCRTHMADSGYAEDMAQETFARFFQTLPDYHHYGKAANYLYAIAANACRDFHRKNREIPVEELPEEADTEGTGWICGWISGRRCEACPERSGRWPFCISCRS